MLPVEKQSRVRAPYALATAVVCSDAPRDRLHTTWLPACLHNIAEREVSGVWTECVAAARAPVRSLGAKRAAADIAAINATR
jgi:hypothetical protein